MARAARAAHLERAVACELEHLPVEQEEPSQTEASYEIELIAQSDARSASDWAGRAISLREPGLADRAQLHVGRIDAVGEVGIAIAELLRQVEDAAVGDLTRAQRRVERQPLDHLRRREQDRLVVPAPFSLTAVERRAVPDRDERIL